MSKKTKNTSRNIAIVGGGATGSVLMIYISKFAKEKRVNLEDVTFHLIDKKEFGYGGIAFGECSDEHILNTLRNEMSPWQPDRFHQYMCEAGKSNDILSIDKRQDFQVFLKSELDKSLKEINILGGKIKKHIEKISLLKSEGTKNTYALLSDSGEALHPDLEDLNAKDIVLTVGYGPNNNFKELHQFIGDGYIHHLYPLHHLENEPSIKKEKIKVAIFGSSAALYDFVIASGLKPKTTEFYIFGATADKQLEIRDIFNEHLLKGVDLEKLYKFNTQTTILEIQSEMDIVFKVSRENEVGPDTWVAFNIVNNSAKILKNLSLEVATEFRKSDFFQKLKRLGGPTSHVASKLLDSYKYECIPQNVFARDIKRNKDKTFMIFSDGKEYMVDCIVNATGHGRHNSSLISDLKEKQLVKINQHLDVLETDESGYRLVGSGLACIGPATHFGTDGVQTFAKYSEKLAREIVDSM